MPWGNLRSCPRASDRTSPRAPGCARSRTAIGSGCGLPIGNRSSSADACGCARPPRRRWKIRLDPGLAFGTGTHPTTALCLQILDSLPLAGRSVIDYGCGSGILGIAALKMGAAHVLAVDLDPQALMATRENASRNGVSSELEVAGVAAQLRPASCVVANILAGPLIELAPTLTDACEAGGDLILSGLLKSQAHELKAASFQHLDDAIRCARAQGRLTYRQFADVVGVKAVHILIYTDLFNYMLVLNLRR